MRVEDMMVGDSKHELSILDQDSDGFARISEQNQYHVLPVVISFRTGIFLLF